MSTDQNQTDEEKPVVIGNVTIELGGKTYQCPIHQDDFVFVDLMEALRNGNDPAKALAWLADAGSRALCGNGIKPHDWRIARSNAIGPTPPRS